MTHLEKLFTFIEDTCEKLGIDESHGLTHSKNCIQWSKKLMEEFSDISEEERTLIIYSVALHDMCDSKYTEVIPAAQNISKWLIEQGWTKELSKSLIEIITTMSYTKLNNKRIQNNGKIVFPEISGWQRAYHIVRQADLIEAYSVGRCFLFQQYKYPSMTEDDCWKVVIDLFNSRIFKYISDGWIINKKALEISLLLQEQAINDLKNKNTVWYI